MKIIIPLITLIVCVGLLEGSLRLHNAILGPEKPYPTIEDKELDWRPNNSNKEGFLAYEHKPDPKKPSLLIIGDSYTQALEVKKGEAYYEFLRSEFNVYAIGAGGWGTVQQYLTLKKYYPLIKPDLVILQFCSNDIINNSYALTRIDYHNYTDYNRQFILNNELVDHRSLSSSFNAYKNFDWLRSVQFLKNKWVRIKANRNSQNLEEKFESRKLPEKLLKKEGLHTTQILQKIVDLVGVKNIKIFNVSRPGILNNKYREIIGELKVESLDEVITEVYKQKNVLAKDGAHFNKDGHRILGQGLKARLQGVFPTSYPP